MKTTTNYHQRVTVPEAFIAQSRQRVKQYGSTVYLRNGDEFEIELFNPTQLKVLAKIKLNGFYLESGIVLRPGERVFLERHLNEPKKFVFETYNVDSNDVRTKEAILYNGNVEIEFYEQYYPGNITTCTPSWMWQPVYYSTTGRNLKYDSGHTGTIGRQGDTFGYSKLSGTMNMCSDTVHAYNTQASLENPTETGRIEKGNYSNQAFNSNSTSFNSWCSWTSVWKILPNSQRPIMKEDLMIYCTKCGAKRKKSSHKYCPSCGNKF